MKIIYGLKNIKKPIGPCAATIGVFDGVHIGHRKVILSAVSAARESGLKSVALTFNPHPAKVLNPKSKIPSLISLGHRIKLIEECGVDTLIILKFTNSFSRVTPEKFVKNVLMNRLRVRELYIGENFNFGYGAGGSAKGLLRMGKIYGFKVKIVRSIKVTARVVSSTLIRSLIMGGKLDLAAKFLGRPVSIFGTVVKGVRLARQLGYPTANINPHHEVIPPCGVYAVRVKCAGRIYGGVLNIGVRPTFFSPRDEEPAIEVHIFRFRGTIYGRDIEVFFVKKLRNEIRFGNENDLIAQIQRDAKEATSVLKS